MKIWGGFGHEQSEPEKHKLFWWRGPVEMHCMTSGDDCMTADSSVL